MQHTALPTMHRPSQSHTSTHTHPRARREPGPGPRTPRGRPLQPRTYPEVAPAAVPPWRPRGTGARPGAAAESDSGQGSAGAEQRLRAGSERRLHPRSAPGGRRRRRRRGGPGSSGARSLRAARSEGAPAPALPLAAARHRRRRPATAPHTSIIHRPSPASRAKPITSGGAANGAAAATAEEAASRAPGASDSPPGMGMGRGRAGGGGSRGVPRKLPTARALCRAPGPGQDDHPPGVLPRGAGGSGEAGRAAAGGGEGRGGAREKDERLADLPRRLQGTPARARPPHPTSLGVRTPAPQPAARTHSRTERVGPATLLRGSESDYESEAAHISNLHAGVVLMHAAAEPTHDRTSGAPASERGRRPGPLPSPA